MALAWSPTTLNFDYEIRSAEDAFHDVPEMKIKGEMLELAKHIINTKKGSFDPSEFKDRYEAALAELVKAKLEGRKIDPQGAPATRQGLDLMAALRRKRGIARQERRLEISEKPASPATKSGAPAGEGELIHGA